MAIEESDVIKQEKILKQLKMSYDMYEKTKKETEKRMKDQLNPDGTKKYGKIDIDDMINMINEAERDVISQYEQNGGNPDDLTKKTRKSKTINSKSEEMKAVMEMMKGRENETAPTSKQTEAVSEERLDQSYIPKKETIDSETSFDIIPLPSNGEGYADKIKKLAVSYLTAYDENLIASPNLYRDNLLLDTILEKKIMSKEIDTMDLLEGDRDAVILFLRASGYGNEYPIVATDDATGKQFDTIVDLSKLKYKEFKLKGDSHGWFSYTLPVSGKEVKFRFPTHRDVVLLEKMEKNDDMEAKRQSIRQYVEDMESFIDSDTRTSVDDKIKIRQAIRTIEKWSERMDDDDDVKFTRSLTNKLNLLVMSVDGITDRDYIYDFIMKMNVKDSSSLRKYMSKNEPGVDYTITVERPESLGGGSFETFLQLDQFLFLNITE